MITAIVQVECFGVASRKTGNNAHPDPAQHTTDPWSYDVINAEEIRTWDQ